MAPRGGGGGGGGRQRDSAEPQALYELGIRGRKTGVTLQDTGARDEFDMQPLEELLSSPERTPFGANGRHTSSDANDSGSDDMDLETSAGPGPRTLLKDRRSYPIPRSRSPVKTNLMSPARKNPHLTRVSSPTRGSVVEELEPTVTRKLDFAGRARGKANGVNGTFREQDEEEEEEEEEEVEEDEDEDADNNDNTENTVIHQSDDEDEDNSDLLEESLQMVEAMAGSTPTPEPEASPPVEQDEEPVIRQSAAKKKGRGRPPKAAPKPIVEEPPEEPSAAEEDPSDEEESQPVAPKRRGRPAKKDSQPKEPAPAPISRKRRSPQKPMEDDNEEPEPEPEPEPEGSASQPKRQRIAQPKASKPEPARPAPAKAAAPKADPKPRGRPGRKPKVQGSGAEGDVGETSFAALQRGPPMPKSRGLVSVRHDADAVRQTRSGRHSYRPLEYWRGEQVIQEEEEMDNMFAKDRFVLPTIKEVIRVPEELPPSKRAPRSKARSKATAKQRPIHPEEEELEDWEINPGTVTGEVIIWEPEHELQPPADDEPVEVMEERVAVSADAIQTKDIRDATFRFAKTLTTPFMGAGVVDLPPGAEKRPKNSRKMHMVFFVHFGKVLVTVNEAQFRITAGGMWFVPRGNYYSITNDYDNASRIFFSQACEVSNQYFDPDQTQNSTMALS
ncbi:mitotic fidelity of chromosome transmission-related protein [Neonectria magnoliae]|uniref:Mitotic fidelity of chromosome transmission-related protein n=1 Tax=Neonectria magnoliae TaxID=2732573 RepID=A0ABR1I6Q4_9HYPO